MVDQQETIEFYENRCCVCHTTFWQKKRGRLRRTCGDRCRQRLHRMRHQQAEEVDRQYKKDSRGISSVIGVACPVCGVILEQAKTGRKRKTCSESCRKRLWRREHPRCLVCRTHFKMAKYQSQQIYCSDRCRSQAYSMQNTHRKRKQAWEEMKGYRPEWMPIPGSGYREEILLVEDAEVEIVREREPKPNYERDIVAEAERRRQEAAELAAYEAYEAEQMAELEAELKEIKKKAEADRRMTSFLFDTEW